MKIEVIGNGQMKEHSESDLNVASFLFASGFRLLGLRLVGRGRYAFRFADENEQAAGAAMAYLQGEVISAKALVGAQRDLKTLMYSASRENGNEDGNGNRRRNTE